MNIVVKARHMNATDAVKDFVEKKVSKLPRYFDNVQQIEVILDIEGDKPSVEIIVSAAHTNPFVATHRGDDLYGCVDLCLDKVSEQLRRHKEKVRDRQGPSHAETMKLGGQ